MTAFDETHKAALRENLVKARERRAYIVMLRRRTEAVNFLNDTRSVVAEEDLAVEPVVDPGIR